MTEQINDQISAFIDDELSAEESALLVRRFERDTEARSQAARYTLIGAALRGELLEPHPSILRHRVAAALSGASTPAAPVQPQAARARSHWGPRALRPAVGFGIAAVVAVAAIFGLRELNDTGPVATVASVPPIAAPVLVRDAAVESASYVVPRDVAEPRAVTPPIRLTNYLMHHGEYASRLSRTSVNSNVVGAADPEPVETAPTADLVLE